MSQLPASACAISKVIRSVTVVSFSVVALAETCCPTIGRSPVSRASTNASTCWRCVLFAKLKTGAFRKRKTVETAPSCRNPKPRTTLPPEMRDLELLRLALDRHPPVGAERQPMAVLAGPAVDHRGVEERLAAVLRRRPDVAERADRVRRVADAQDEVRIRLHVRGGELARGT